METRSRKRAEATSHRPSPPAPSRSSKRARVSSANSNPSSASVSASASASASATASATASAATFTFPRSRPSTRAAASTPTAPPVVIVPGVPSAETMDSARDSSAPSGSRRAHFKSSKKDTEKEEWVTDRAKESKEREAEKGKEKELDKEKHRGRDRDRAPAAGGGGDDDHEGEGGSSLHQNLASASSALHGLLRKLGAGLDDLLPSSTSSSHQNSRLKRILSGLRAEGEEGRQLDSLSQLCELLSIGTEDSLSSFSVDSFVPVLVGLLNYEYNPDMMLLAARALTHLCDVLPSSCAAVVHYGAVPCFCARLLTIEYIDMAEQSLQALEKISHEHPTACLRAGALTAVLSYLDFFSTGVQRVAVSTAANICRQLPSDAADFVMEAVPILTNLLQYQDSKVVEHSSVCLTRIAESFASSPEKLDTLCSHGLLPQAARLVSVGNPSGSLIPQTSLSTSTYTGVIRLLSACASGSAAAAESLLLLRISSILKDILAGSGAVSSTTFSPSSVNRPPEQLYEIVTLVNELLPPTPETSAISVPLTSNGITVSRSTARKYSAVASKTEETGKVNSNELSPREKLLRDQPELLLQFGVDLFPVLVQVYGSSVSPLVRHKCLAAISKLLHFSTPDMLRSLLRESNISSFLAGVLASKDASILITALQIAEMLMQKVPDVFGKLFVKEGVVHAIDQLIASESSIMSPPAAPAAWKSGDASSSGAIGAPTPTPTPQRPRRGGSGRRRSSGNHEPSAAEEPPGGSSNTLVSSLGSPPSATLEPGFRTLRSGLKAAAITAAKRFKSLYFSDDSGLIDVGVTESLCKLKFLCAKLNGECPNEVKGKGKGKAKAVGVPSSEEELAGLISEILSELGGEDGVSTFEFVGSGVVGSLLNYLTVKDKCKYRWSDSNAPELREEALRRFKQFIDISLPGSCDGKEAPLTMLVRKLQNALASLERFPVVVSYTPRSSSGTASVTAGLSALTQPFKLRLSRSSSEKVLRDYSSKIVLIEPLATLVAVEDFLWPRVKRHDSVSTSTTFSNSDAVPTSTTPPGPGSVSLTSPPSSVERRPSTRSRSSTMAANTSGFKDKDLEGVNITSTKWKGKAVSRGILDNADEHPGPETRNAAARRRAAAAEASAKKASQRSNAPYESEDDELDPCPLEIAGAVTMVEDDLSVEEEDEDDDDHEEVFGDEPASMCIGIRVHDVHMGDGADGGSVPSASSPAVELVSQSGGLSTGRTGVSLSGKGSILTGSERPTMRTGLSLGNTGSLSFAAATMNGMTSVNNGNGSRLGSRSNAANSSPKLQFSMGGKILDRSLTIVQAIQSQSVTGEDDEEERYAGPDYLLSSGRRLWDDVYTINYQRADSAGEHPPESSSMTNTSSLGVASMGQRGATLTFGTKGSWQQASLLDSILEGELPCDLEKTSPTYNILLLLRILEGLNRIAHRLRLQGAADCFAKSQIESLDACGIQGPLVHAKEFLNSKLTPKLARQLQDALALCSGGLPAWCHQLTRACPFLFPFETRRQYFHSTAFGLSRALQRLQQQQNADGSANNNDRELRVGRLQRQKVRVSRNRILDSAAKVMELYSGHKAVLEVEYFGEVGTGLGPTLEFYTLLSQELQRCSVEMWRRDSNRIYAQSDASVPDADGGNMEESYLEVESVGYSVDSARRSDDFVLAPHGLFPRPWPPGKDTSENSKYGKVIEQFRFLGRVMAKALQDGRLLDLPLSPAFYKLVLGQELDIFDIKTFDPDLGRSLQEMQFLIRRKQFFESTGSDSRQAVEALRLRDLQFDDLCLDFTLPGYPDYVLKKGGSDEMVNIDNLEEYISLVVDASVKSGIAAQLQAFRTGFDQVFPTSSLQVFTEDELDSLLCGAREVWMPETLSDLLKFDHGYTASSPPIRNLLELMGEFTPHEQQAFLRFVTGAPRLPPGGLSTLSPKLTIVRKHPTGLSMAGLSVLGSTPPGAAGSLGTTLADGDLPSVMTCANYLKLPPYSCKEVMRDRLMYALREGQGSFDLS